MNTNDEHQLSHQQQRFCDEYLVHFNAFKAAVNAGYSDNTARKGELLHLPKVQYYLQDAMRKTQSRLEITHDMILSEFAKIAFSNMGNYYDEYAVLKPMNQLTNDEKAAISQYQIMDAMDDRGQRIGELSKIKLHNKMAALDRIARHLGFYGVSPKSESPEVRKTEERSPMSESPEVRKTEETSPMSESPEVGKTEESQKLKAESLKQEESVKSEVESQAENILMEEAINGLLVTIPTKAAVFSPEVEVESQESFQYGEEHIPTPLFPIAIGRESHEADAFELGENIENILTLSPPAQWLNDIMIEGLNGATQENGNLTLAKRLCTA